MNKHYDGRSLWHDSGQTAMHASQARAASKMLGLAGRDAPVLSTGTSNQRKENPYQYPELKLGNCLLYTSPSPRD